MVDTIQADYEQMEQIAARFAKQAEQTTAIFSRMQRSMANLEQGGWEGEGAKAFFAEMKQEILPAGTRLSDSLEQSTITTKVIADIIKQAEEDGARPFQKPDFIDITPTIPSRPPSSGGGGGPFAPSTNKKPWVPLDAPLQGNPGNRDPQLYDRVIDQFGVEENPRYRVNQQGKNETYCNIFIWDVTRAMGAEIPHWVDKDGNPTAVGKGRELSANGAINWLEKNGGGKGWRRVGPEEAQAMANQGQPSVAAWKNPHGIGHVAMVRPGEYSSQQGPLLAQSGARNLDNVRTANAFQKGWSRNEVVYYVHD